MFTTRPELAGTFGMVASTHWLASAAGMAVLEKGGNAFDAAVAAGFTLQVVEPHLNGPGGEVPVIGHDARRGETFVVCGQGTAPAAATAAAPSSATATWWPRFSRRRFNISQMVGLSSTNKIRAMRSMPPRAFFRWN